MDPGKKGRTAITGREGSAVWDFLRLSNSRNDDNFQRVPHLTLSIQQEDVLAIVVIPHGIRSAFRKKLLAGGLDGFRDLFEQVLNNFRKALGGIEGAAPWIEIVQRRYPNQRSEPIIDAVLQFDLRTGFDKHNRVRRPVKQQPQWLEAAYEAMAHKKSNIQLGVGATFRYDRCPVVNTADILQHVANTWIACKPIVETMNAKIENVKTDSGNRRR